MELLLKRWNIEGFHRDAKQHLGLESYQVRKYKLIAQKGMKWLKRKAQNLMKLKDVMNKYVVVKNAKV